MNEWPTGFWELGSLLLHQQCWHFGQDVKSCHGNLLLTAGFERTRPPSGLQASSRYLRIHADRPALCLWAFGLMAFHPGEGGIYVNRYNFVPRWVPDAEEALGFWKPAFFDHCAPPLTYRTIRRSRQLLRHVLLSFAAYEEDVIARCGIEYRRQSLHGWRLPAILPSRMAFEWRSLSWHIPEPPVPGTTNVAAHPEPSPVPAPAGATEPNQPAPAPKPQMSPAPAPTPPPPRSYPAATPSVNYCRNS